MTEPISAKGTGYPIINLLLMCVPISMKTNKDANNSHIEIYLFPRHLPSLAIPFLINRIDFWIVGYWLSTYVCWNCMN